MLALRWALTRRGVVPACGATRWGVDHVVPRPQPQWRERECRQAQVAP